MSALTVFLASTGPADGVLDVLQDLTGVGLAGPFVWVTDGSDEVWTVADGRRTGSALEGAVIDRQRTRVRLCVLVPAGGAAVVSSEAELRMHELLRAHAGLESITRVRAVLAGAGDTLSGDAVARDGWHNVLVAPEDSRGPGLGHALLPGGAHPVELGRHAAPTLAGVLGLWTGAPACVFDDRPLPPDASVRAARGFFRRVDASDLDDGLRSRVLATGPELPLPLHHGSSAVPIVDVPRACAEMADGVWKLHPEVFGLPRRPIAAPVVRSMGFLESLRWFFTFLGNALRRAPRDLVDAARNHAARRIAVSTQELVFGQGSSYVVVLNGMSGHGPLGVADLAVASRDLDAGLSGGPARQDAPVDLDPLWNHVAEGALTLVDAGRRALDPVVIGAHLGVLRVPADAAPGPDADFVVRARLVPRVQTDRVAAADVLGVHVLRAAFGQAAQDARDRNLAHEAETAQHDLERWFGGHRHSYTVQVGDRLLTRLLHVVGEIRDLAAWLRDVGTEDDGFGRRARSLYGRLKIISGIAFVLLVAAGVMGAAGFVTWPTAGIIGGATVVSWLVACFVAYALEQRRLFQEFHRLQALPDQVETARQHLAQAVEDLRRLSLAYTEYLPWARALGTVLASPFGAASAAPRHTARIVRGLPRSTRLADVVVADGPTEAAARMLRQGLFTTGWLTAPWRRAVASVRHEGGALQPGWADRLGARDGTFGEEAWKAAVARLDAPGNTLGTDLLARVRGIERGSPPSEEITEFLGGVNRSSPGGQFDGEHFVPTLRTADPARVDIELVQRVRRGLGTQAVLVQLSAAVPARELSLTAGRAADEPADDHVVPPFPAF